MQGKKKKKKKICYNVQFLLVYGYKKNSQFNPAHFNIFAQNVL